MINETPVAIPPKPEPPLQGLGIAAILVFAAVVASYGPQYMGGFRSAFIALAIIFLAIGIGGAIIEIGKIWTPDENVSRPTRKQAVRDGTTSLGAGSVFVIPAVALHLFVIRPHVAAAPWDMLVRLSVLFLITVGGGLLFYSVPHLLWNPNRATNGRQRAGKKATRKTPPPQAKEKHSTLKNLMAWGGFASLVLKVIQQLMTLMK